MKRLLEEGHSTVAVAEMSGVPASTLARWKPTFGALTLRWRPAHSLSYAYLLGLYLGDGCLHRNKRGGVLLRVSLDARYEQIVQDCWCAMQLVMPESRTGLLRHKAKQMVDVQSSTKRWLLAFPQHGPGRKHLRSIVLEDWQQNIVERHRAHFVRGLIHSDGCRTINRFTTKLPSGRAVEYSYARYFFSNLSHEIRGLFCDSCDAMGVRWTQSNPRNISVAHRPSVRILDELGCAKEPADGG